MLSGIDTYWRIDTKVMSKYTAFCLLSYERNRFKLLCFCTVINHRRSQDAMRTSVAHSAASRVRLCCSYYKLTSSVSYVLKEIIKNHS